MVTYKWPTWLHKQSDKQRIIWAYKILFLDVLFPLDIKRIIFCDSDQIIRTDMVRLVFMSVSASVHGHACLGMTHRQDIGAINADTLNLSAPNMYPGAVLHWC